MFINFKKNQIFLRVYNKDLHAANRKQLVCNIENTKTNITSTVGKT